MPVMRRAVAGFAHSAGQLLYPSTCLICDAPEGESAAFRHGLCKECRVAVTTDPFPACPWCAQTVGPHTDTSKGCTECRGTAHGFECAFRLGPYAGRLR